MTERKQVTHRMFDLETGILPCCGLSRYAVVQSDRVSMDEQAQPVTCDGTQRRLKGALRVPRR